MAQMSCTNCPPTTTRAATTGLPPRPIRARVTNYSQEKVLMAKYPGYHVSRQILGSNTTILILTRP